ncbi:MAG: WecB/TagA/CpsF family glycosyltransferase [Candidatus Hydrogenedentales bacterium]
MSALQERKLDLRAQDQSKDFSLESHLATGDASQISVFGVRISNVDEASAVGLLEQMIDEYDGRARAVYYVNAHTLNFAAQQPEFRAVLNRADCVFDDGTGVRWAARCRGVRMKANVNGTDLVPRLFHDTAGRGLRYYLLGAAPDMVARAATEAQNLFPGWTLAGYHHGYFDKHHCPEVIDQINAAEPHVLLVCMGNPLQEQWIDRHLGSLSVPICMGTGALCDRWAGDLPRAPRWIRGLGYEWAHVLLQQPHKWRRYLLGNPQFLWRMIRYLRSDLC